MNKSVRDVRFNLNFRGILHILEVGESTVNLRNYPNPVQPMGQTRGWHFIKYNLWYCSQ